MSNAFGYTRLSKDPHDKEVNGLKSQSEHVLRYFDYRLKGSHEWGELFPDEGVSGNKELRSRPQGARLDRALQRGDAVIIPKLDRGFRNTQDMLNTLEVWERRGVTVHLLDCQVDTSTASGRLFMTMLAAIAEFERSRIIERIREKADLRRSMGLTGNGMAPYGFKKALVLGQKRIVPDDWTRHLGGRIVECRAKGHTFDAIYWYLLKNACRQRNGKEISRSLVYKWFVAEMQLRAKDAGQDQRS
jgi:DNA invertase Pin-like site-specific DNA recombinase